MHHCSHFTGSESKRCPARLSVTCGIFWLTVTATGIFASPLHQFLARRIRAALAACLVGQAFQVTVNVITWTERHTNRRRIRWLSRACVLLFVGTCFLYFSLCRGLGYAIEVVVSLVGFLPAFPVAAWAARFLMTLGSKFWPSDGSGILCALVYGLLLV